MLFFSAATGLQAQATNLVKNGSFEASYDQYPRNISYHNYGTNPLEVTRCLCLDNYTIPSLANRPTVCKDWYDPTDGNYGNNGEDYVGSPDYFNRRIPYRIPYDTYGHRVDVPHNYRNKLGYNTDSYIQQPFDDDEEDDIDSCDLPYSYCEDAYIGIGNSRTVSNTTPPPYAEYITQKLSNTMQADEIYLVSYRISWAKESDPYPLTEHYLINNFDAFFGTSPFVQEGAKPVDKADTDPGLCKLARNDGTNDNLNQHGGTEGLNWMLVTGLFAPTENLDYMTIGNFKSNWTYQTDYDGPAVQNDDVVTTYYYIDSVNVYELEDGICNCTQLEDPFIILTPIQSQNDKCCYEISIVNNADCYLTINKDDKISISIREPMHNGDQLLSDYSDFTFSTMIQCTSFFENGYFIIESTQDKPIIIPPGQTLTLGSICIPNDGNIYQIHVNLEECADVSNFFYRQCLPEENSCCSTDIDVSYDVDMSQPKKCCYYIYVDNTGSSCPIDKIRVFDVQPETSTDLKDYSHIGTKFYEDGVDGDTRGRVFGEFCVEGQDSRKLVVQIIFEDGTICQKELTNIICPIDECCNSIDVVPNTPTTNANGDCCYTFNITNDDPNCLPSSLTISEVDPLNGLIPLVTVANPIGSSIPQSPICLTQLDGNKNLQFEFQYPNAVVCTKFISISCPDDCCNKFSMTVSPTPNVYDHSSVCCYSVNYTIDQGFNCPLKRIVIERDDGYVLWEVSGADVQPGVHYKEICIDKDKMDDTGPMNLNIKYMAPNDYQLCSDETQITPCTGSSEPCGPPLDQGDVPGPWIENDDDKRNRVFVRCPGKTEDCFVRFKFATRTVENNGQIVHRDIQVLDMEFTKAENCDCIDKIAEAIIKKITSRIEVLTQFRLLPDDDWEEGYENRKCYNDFRVISTDCWEEKPFPIKLKEYHKKCNDAVCCYAIYEICVERKFNKPFEDIFTTVSIDKISQSSTISDPCIPPCTPMHCDSWTSIGESHQAKMPIIIQTIENSDCKLVLNSNINMSEIFLNLECPINGEVNIKFVDLIGEQVYSTIVQKNNYYLTIPVDKQLQSGVYFIRVTIDNTQVLFDKINIIR